MEGGEDLEGQDRPCIRAPDRLAPRQACIKRRCRNLNAQHQAHLRLLRRERRERRWSGGKPGSTAGSTPSATRACTPRATRHALLLELPHAEVEACPSPADRGCGSAGLDHRRTTSCHAVLKLRLLSFVVQAIYFRADLGLLNLPQVARSIQLPRPAGKRKWWSPPCQKSLYQNLQAAPGDRSCLTGLPDRSFLPSQPPSKSSRGLRSSS